MTRKLTLTILLNLLFVCAAFAQTTQTTAFTYQGSLNTSGTPATGNFDFEFALFDALSGGAQFGATLTRNTVPVANGIFSVSLDFGSQFPGANRFLEIRVRLSGGGAFTPLTPRQQVNSAPYAVKSLNADLLGGVAANQYLTTTGGGGTINTIPFWSGPTTLGNSQITQSVNGVQLPNGVQLAAGAQGNAVSLGSPNGETGMSISGATGRVNLRFGGTNPSLPTLKLVVGPAGGPPPERNGIVITTDGNVGIGITPSGAKLQVDSFADDGIFSVSNFGFAYGVNGQGNGGGLRGFTSGSGARGVYGISTSGNGIEGSNNGNNSWFGVFSDGFLGTNRLGSTSFPNTSLCLNGSNQISSCNSSSLRYKTNVGSFGLGLDLIKRMRPIVFDWKIDGSHDFGLGAEDVEKIAPQLVVYQDGKVDGVRYDRLSVVLINAVKEQQAQIEALRRTNASLTRRLQTIEKKVKKTVRSGGRQR